MTGTLIAPVIPSSAAARPARAPAAARTLPLTVPPVRPPALPRDVVYGLARVDRSGRVADRTVTGALGWRGGDRLAGSESRSTGTGDSPGRDIPPATLRSVHIGDPKEFVMNVRAVSGRFGAAVLLIGPLGLVLGALFAVAGDDDSVSVSLAKIAAHPSGERAVIVCDLLAAFMLPAVLYLMRLAGPRAPRLTLVGGAVAFAAWLAGLVSLGASDLLYDHAAQLSDRASAISLVHAVTSDAAFVIPEVLFIVGHVLGLLLLGIALWRGRAVPRWAAGLVGLAPVVQFLVNDQGDAVNACAFGLFLIGMAACAVTLLHTPPEPTLVSAAATDPLVTTAPSTR